MRIVNGAQITQDSTNSGKTKLCINYKKFYILTNEQIECQQNAERVKTTSAWV